MIFDEEEHDSQTKEAGAGRAAPQQRQVEAGEVVGVLSRGEEIMSNKLYYCCHNCRHFKREDRRRKFGDCTNPQFKEIFGTKNMKDRHRSGACSLQEARS